jgi:hypothetical protein
MLEAKLTEWGVRIVHKRRMHEKLIFVDDDITWVNSLNSLSFRESGEHFERRKSKSVFEDYARLMRLDDLLAEHDSGQPTCPTCRCEVVASDGRTEPFYWRCENARCGYARGVNDPRPEGGQVLCKTCAGPLECGQWGGKATWRCPGNPRHRQKVLRWHLLLPKMRALVPKDELRRLDRAFNISPGQIVGTGRNGQILLQINPE